MFAERRKATVCEIERKLTQAQELHRQMGMRAREDHGPNRTDRLGKNRTYANQISQLNSALLSSAPAPGMSSLDSLESQQRGRMNETGDRIDRTNEMLDRTQQSLLMAEQSGINSLAALGEQDQKLRDALDGTRDIDSTVSKSQRVLKNIQRRLLTDKILLMLIVGIEGLIIFLMIFFKWIYPHFSPAAPEPAPEPTNTTNSFSATAP